MGIKRTVFDSKAELDIFRDLSKKGTNRYIVQQHVPFKDIITNDTPNISKKTWDDFLYKTNFDFVVISTDEKDYGKPLLIIEFDGCGCGYSKDGKYIQLRKVENDSYRKLKLDTKIRICEQEGIPIVVISWEEISPIFKDYSLTILDGIIGKVLSEIEFKELFQAPSEELSEALENAQTLEDKRNIIDGFGISCEVTAELNNNPIAHEAARIHCLLRKKGIHKSFGYRPIKQDKLTGYEFYAILEDGSEISKKALIREINCKKIYVNQIALDIAELMLWCSIADEYGIGLD